MCEKLNRFIVNKEEGAGDELTKVGGNTTKQGLLGNGKYF